MTMITYRILHLPQLCLDCMDFQETTDNRDISFSSEFIVMKHGVETSCRFQYKLHKMGVPLDGPSFAYSDNMSVINNTQ